ncbi:MAG: fibro-slime domain-containing protein [Oscillospiraceae bacterium]|nr:fibro-slime domain-containing protein [Oscillospiraceae bacterium]
MKSDTHRYNISYQAAAISLCLLILASVLTNISLAARAAEENSFFYAGEEVEHTEGVPDSFISEVTSANLTANVWDQRWDTQSGANNGAKIATATERQFLPTWQDQTSGVNAGFKQGIFGNILGADGKPLPRDGANSAEAASGDTLGIWGTTTDGSTTGGALYRWFNDAYQTEDDSKDYTSAETARQVSKLVYDDNYTMEFVLQKGTQGAEDVYVYDKTASFYPVEGNEFSENDTGEDHNFGFTVMTGAYFKLTGKVLGFDFQGDDDVFLYINDMLVLDLGGIHASENGKVYIDEDGKVWSRTDAGTDNAGVLDSLSDTVTYDGLTYRAVPDWSTAAEDDQLTLAQSQTHEWKLFFAERSPTASNVKITTSMMMTVELEKDVSASEDRSGFDYFLTVVNTEPYSINLTHYSEWLNDNDVYEDDGGFAQFGTGDLSELQYATSKEGPWSTIYLDKDFQIVDEDGEPVTITIPKEEEVYFRYSRKVAGAESITSADETKLFSKTTIKAVQTNIEAVSAGAHGTAVISPYEIIGEANEKAAAEANKLKPVSPSDTEPVSPSDTEPVSPSDTEPVSPSDTEPVSPSDTEPVSPSDTKPASPSDTEPVSPSDTGPVSPSDTEPTEPTAPTSPAKQTPSGGKSSGTSSNGGSTDAPSTGDDSDLAHLLLVMLTSGAGMAAAFVLIMRRKKAYRTH